MITEDQRIKIESVKNKLRIGAKIEKADYDIKLFENIRFRKVRRAMKKWQQ